MPMLQICDMVEWELDMYRLQCNFTENESTYFDLKSKGFTIEEIAEKMNVTVGTVNNLSRKVREKMNRVL